MLDIVKRRSVRGKRIWNMIILWLMGTVVCLGIMTFWPYFWPYLLGVSLVLFLSYGLFWVYKQNGVRIVLNHMD